MKGYHHIGSMIIMAKPIYEPQLEQARFVKAPQSLVPRQHHTPASFQKTCDFYMFWAPKHSAAKSEFHSYEEYLYAGLLEGDPTVSAFVPQPFLYRIHGRYYTPDCYVVRNGQTLVIEIKPHGEFSDGKRIPMMQHCRLFNMDFQVISNESIRERELEALNWIEIAHTLYANTYLETIECELRLLDLINQDQHGILLGDIVDPGHREKTFLDEIGVLRLLHKGKVSADMTQRPFDFDTVLQSCM
jgi:hypothetical protein